MYKVGDKVWSGVYGFASIESLHGDDHVTIAVPNDDSFVVSVHTIQKLGEA